MLKRYTMLTKARRLHRPSRRSSKYGRISFFESQYSDGYDSFDEYDKDIQLAIETVENAFERAGYTLDGSDVNEDDGETLIVVSVKSDARTEKELDALFERIRVIADRALYSLLGKVSHDFSQCDWFDAVPEEHTCGVLFSMY